MLPELDSSKKNIKICQFNSCFSFLKEVLLLFHYFETCLVHDLRLDVVCDIAHFFFKQYHIQNYFQLLSVLDPDEEPNYVRCVSKTIKPH